MNEFVNGLFKFMLVLSAILGVTLLVIAGILILEPGLLLKIIKTAIIAVCAASGVSLLAITVVFGIKYILLKKSTAKKCQDAE